MDTDHLLAYSIVITEKILITFSLFYFICNLLISCYKLNILTLYLYFVSFFYYLKCLRKTDGTAEHRDMKYHRFLEDESEMDFQTNPPDDIDTIAFKKGILKRNYEKNASSKIAPSNKLEFANEEKQINPLNTVEDGRCNENSNLQLGYQYDPQTIMNLKYFQRRNNPTDLSHIENAENLDLASNSEHSEGLNHKKDKNPIPSVIYPTDRTSSINTPDEKCLEYDTDIKDVSSEHIAQDFSSDSIEQMDYLIDQMSYSLCSTCNIIKTRLTKHCPICDKCLIIFHHCTFLNNCISENNKNDYLFLLIFLTLASVISRNIINLMFSTVSVTFLLLYLYKRIKTNIQYIDVQDYKDIAQHKYVNSNGSRKEMELVLDDEQKQKFYTGQNTLSKSQNISDSQISNTHLKNNECQIQPSTTPQPHPYSKITKNSLKQQIINIAHAIEFEIKQIKWKYVLVPWLRREVSIIE